MVGLIAPYTMREHRESQLDMLLSKTRTGGAARVRGGFDIYNLLNASDVLSIVTTYGPTWRQPGGVLAARLYKFNVQIAF